jgi:chromosome segregation ATPase
MITSNKQIKIILMDFYASKDEPLRPNVSLADMIGEDVNRSFNSAISAASSGSAGPSSSSKAVLAALRALQDKIRRLETERSQALDEASQLRLQLKNQEIEHEHAKQREQLATQKSLQEAKTSLERIQHEKCDLEERLHSLEGRNRSLQQSSEELQVRIRKLEEDKQHGNGRLRDLENQHSILEQQIRLAQQREKGTLDMACRRDTGF